MNIRNFSFITNILHSYTRLKNTENVEREIFLLRKWHGVHFRENNKKKKMLIEIYLSSYKINEMETSLFNRNYGLLEYLCKI